MWNGYGVCSNRASSGEPPLLHMTTLTTARTLHSQINVRVSRPGAKNCRVPLKYLPTSKGISMKPPGLLPSWCTQPTGSFATGTPAATKARATRSFSMWCLDNLQTRLCRPRASPASRIDKGAGHTSSPRRNWLQLIVEFEATGCNRQRKQPVSAMTGGNSQNGSQLKRTVKAGLNLAHPVSGSRCSFTLA